MRKNLRGLLRVYLLMIVTAVFYGLVISPALNDLLNYIERLTQ